MTKVEKALSVLLNGGYFREMLEKNSYTKREVFVSRLFDKDNRVVKGIGTATFLDMKNDLIRDYSCPSFSSFCKIYRHK
jgi:hypothetical protein